MRTPGGMRRTVRAAGASILAMATTAGGAFAGGFDIREQSALFQGMSFAGAAAGGTSLGSMFWNPAAAAYVGNGITFDSSFSLILPRADVTVETVGGGPVSNLAPLDPSVDFGENALVPASYVAYRYSEDIVFAMSMNSQFGLATDPDSFRWAGDVLGRTSEVFSINAVPTITYRVAPGIQVGAGVQLQYFEIKDFKTAGGVPGGSTANLEGDDFGVGYTLGINLTPAAGTSIGLGFRSSIRHDLEGDFDYPGSAVDAINADLELPEKLTLGLRQDIAPGIRAHATVEWTNWSRLGVIPVNGSNPAVELSFNWEDGWFFALGGEYDYSENLTLRTGFGYEISPIREASQRLVQLPDNDRYWLSAGGSYKVGDLMGMVKDAEIDFAYTHVFVEEGDFARDPALVSSTTLFTGSTDSAVDIISIGLRSKL